MCPLWTHNSDVRLPFLNFNSFCKSLEVCTTKVQMSVFR